MPTKMIFSLALLAATAATANAAEVRDARINAAQGVLELDVATGIGCGVHSYELSVESTEFYTTHVRLVDLATEPCGGSAAQDTIRFPLEAGLLGRIAGDTLIISGDNDTRVKVKLPGGWE